MVPFSKTTRVALVQCPFANEEPMLGTGDDRLHRRVRRHFVREHDAYRLRYRDKMTRPSAELARKAGLPKPSWLVLAHPIDSRNRAIAAVRCLDVRWPYVPTVVLIVE